MRRTQLTEYGIIVIGLIFGYKFFESVVTVLIQLLFSFEGLNGRTLEFLAPVFVSILIYGISFIILIRQSHQAAQFLNKGGQNETVELKIGKKALLHIILIVLAAVVLITAIPEIVMYLFYSFKNEISNRRQDAISIEMVNKSQFYTAALRAVIAVVIIIYAKDITGWFIRKNEADELVFDTTPQKD